MDSDFTTPLAILLLAYILLRVLLHFTQDTQEPPSVDNFIPFIGPLFRMTYRGVDYWLQNSHRPIYTIRLPGTRLYVVNSTALIPVVQRQVKGLSFSPILSWVASNLIAASKPGVDILSDDEEHGFISNFHRFNVVNLSSGACLSSLNEMSWKIVTSYRPTDRADSQRMVKMHQWIGEQMTAAATEAMYGDQNPFRDPEIQKIWQKYQYGITHLMTGFVASLTARQSIRARKDLAAAFESYYEKLATESREPLAYVKERYHFFSESGLSLQDIAKTEAAFTMALLSNTIPATFWLVYHIFSDDIALQDCRKELTAALRQGSDGVYSLDIETVNNACPVLFSTYMETLRLHASGISVRQVVGDQLLDGQYLLKTGSLVMIPAGVQHQNKSLWGANVDEFDHRRFLQTKTSQRNGSRAAFRAFGGGLTLCPGRHFATSSILGFAARTILDLDVQPVGGEWRMPTTKNSCLSAAINQPDTDVDVLLHSRKAQEWKPVFSASKDGLQASADTTSDKESLNSQLQFGL